MRVALIADIHGNLVAFEAVLAEIAREQVDAMVCLGDVAAFGPQPDEVVSRLRALGCPVVMGDADATLLSPLPPAEHETLRRLQEIDRWAAGRLSPGNRTFLASFAPTVTLEMDGVALLCYHGSPLVNTDRLYATTSDADLERFFAGTEAQIYAGGHTHLQLLRRYRNAVVLNPGSVGLPYDRVPSPDVAVRNPPWGEYALVTVADGRLAVDLRRVPFDVAALRQAAHANAMPYADWWCAEWDGR